MTLQGIHQENKTNNFHTMNMKLCITLEKWLLLNTTACIICKLNLSPKVLSKTSESETFVSPTLYQNWKYKQHGVRLRQLFFRQRSRKKAMNKGNATREDLFRMGAHQNHTSSSDSCSRSAFFRSPTSEVQPFLSLDLINLRKKKMISGYMISRVKTLQQYADYSLNE